MLDAPQDAPPIDLAGVVREREAADKRLKDIGAAVLRELVRTPDAELTKPLAALKAKMLGE